MNKKPVSVFVNLPFCDGCDFCTDDEFGLIEGRVDKYVAALINEIKSKREMAQGRNVGSIFFGGAGASLIPDVLLVDIMLALDETFEIEDDCEITLELSPKSPHIEDLEFLDKIGITRLNILAHSVDDIVLGVMGKTYRASDIQSTLDAIKTYGHFDVNIDFTTCVPVPKEIADMDLRRSPEVELASILVNFDFVDHISLYDLVVEDGTDLARALDYNQVYFQKFDDQVNDHVLLHGVLEKFGLYQYDSHHWARPGSESVYNRSHIEIESECFGFGLGANGIIDDVRYDNFDELDLYILAPNKVEHQEKRTTLDKVNEAIINQLGTPNGVDLAGLKELGIDLMASRKKEITHLRSMKLVKATKNTLTVTKHGAMLINVALSELLFGEEEEVIDGKKL